MVKGTGKPIANTILMVGPIFTGDGYIGGIGMIMRQLMECWDVPSASVVHFNTELLKRPYGTTGQMCGRNLFLSIVNFARLLYSVAKVRPHLVHYHTSRGLAFVKDMVFAGSVRWFFSVKIILHLHSSDARSTLMSHARGLQRCQLKLLQHCCDRLIVLSDNVLHDFASILGGDAGRKLRARCIVLRNSTVLPDACRKHQKANDSARIFYIGNIGREKGIYDIMEAARRLKGKVSLPFQVILAGPFNDRQEEQRVRTMVASYQLDDTVAFLGTVYDGVKEAAFLQADIFILPSYSEGIPQSMLEAMAFGLPVVVSNVGGIPEVVRDGEEGLIVKPGDIDALCGALRQLIESVEYRRKMGAAARRRIAMHHTVEIYMRQLRDVYRPLLATRRPDTTSAQGE